MEYSSEFVAKVNEIYHDAEGRVYEKKHPEIFVDEIERWKNFGQKYLLPLKQEVTLLDYGSGTGFVPLQLSAFLKPGDRLVCSDISRNILDICRENLIGRLDESVLVDYIKLDGQSVALDSGLADFITVNSVLHHIQDLENFFSEIDRVLRAGGYLVIAHEPNLSFFQDKFLWYNYKAISWLFNPKQAIVESLMRIRLFELARSIYGLVSPEIKTYNKIIEETNRRLLSEKIIDKELSAAELTKIVDIHSPGAGGEYSGRGFEVSSLQAQYLKGYEIDMLATYDHISNTSTKNRITRWYDDLLRKKFPNRGSHFLVVFRKAS